MFWVLNWLKYGELLFLFGFFFVFVIGYYVFEFVGLKGDLGVLIIGMMFVVYKKVGELLKFFFNLKDILFVGFFLNIGLNVELISYVVFVVLVLVFVLLIKVVLYYVLINVFKLCVCIFLLSVFSFVNYSEFGFIVCVVVVLSNMIILEWFVVMVIVVLIIFILVFFFNKCLNEIYVKIECWLFKFESDIWFVEELLVNFNDIKIVIFGMGWIGIGVYEIIS